MSGTQVQNVSLVGVCIALSMSAWLTVAVVGSLPPPPPPLHAVSASIAAAMPAVSPVALRRHALVLLDMFTPLCAGVRACAVRAGAEASAPGRGGRRLPDHELDRDVLAAVLAPRVLD